MSYAQKKIQNSDHHTYINYFCHMLLAVNENCELSVICDISHTNIFWQNL